MWVPNTTTAVMVGRVPDISRNYQSTHQLKIGGGDIFVRKQFLTRRCGYVKVRKHSISLPIVA